MSRPLHLRQSHKYSLCRDRDRQAHSQGACSSRGARRDQTAVVYRRNAAGGVCFAVELREMLAAAAIPTDLSTGSYFKCWPNSTLSVTHHFERTLLLTAFGI